MFWVGILLGGREYLGVLDTGTSISIVTKKILPCGDLKNIMPTAAIRMGDGYVVHSCGDCEVGVPMGSKGIAHRLYVNDTEAFDFVLGTDFFVEHSKIPSLTLQTPYVLQVDHGDGWESVPLEQSEHTSGYLRVCKREPSTMMAAFKSELLGDVQQGYTLFFTPLLCCGDHHCRILKEKGTFSWPPHGFKICLEISYNIPNIGNKALHQGSRQVLLSHERHLQLPLRSLVSLEQLWLGRGLEWTCQSMCA